MSKPFHNDSFILFEDDKGDSDQDQVHKNWQWSFWLYIQQRNSVSYTVRLSLKVFLYFLWKLGILF